MGVTYPVSGEGLGVPLHRRYLQTIGLLIVLLSSSARTSMAQDATSSATPATGDSAANPAVQYLPTADSLGDGWSSVMTEPLAVSPEEFRTGAIAVLTGPAGARVLAVAMLVTDERVAVRRSWEEASDLFHKYSGELEYDSDRDEILDRLPLPPGCIEAKRIDGTARQLGLDTGIPMGLTLCAADPDVIVLAVVSGELGALSGHDASDGVASLMLGAIESIDHVTPAAG
jgi:hypothetical protein